MICPTLMGLFLCIASVVPTEAAQINDRYNFFDIELLEAMTSTGDDNVIVSPASVKAALTTLVEGTGGRTAEEILSLLRLSSDPADIRAAAKRAFAPFTIKRAGSEMALATRLWTGDNVKVNQQYRESLIQNYHSDIQRVNFGDSVGSTNQINDWVYQQTRGLIPSIVTSGSLDPGTKLLLTNALYLKGNWKTSFDRNLTRIACFQVPNYGCQDSYMMHSLEYYPYAYIPSLAADVVEIPYTDGVLSMLIILPVRPEDGINRLSRDLAHTSLSTIFSSLEETEVQLALPRFTIEMKSDLRPVLEKLGVRDLFSSPNANISGIIEGPVQVGSVLHSAKIEVNEEGTIAAAVTAAAVIPLMGSSSQRFIADRPFIFILREAHSGCVLFAGRMTKPDLAASQGREWRPNQPNSNARRRGV